MIRRKDSLCTKCHTKGNKVNKEKYIQTVYEYKVIIHGHTEQTVTVINTAIKYCGTKKVAVT